MRPLVLWPDAYTAHPAYDPCICRVRASLNGREARGEKIDPAAGIAMDPGMRLLRKGRRSSLPTFRTSKLDIPLISRRHGENVAPPCAYRNGRQEWLMARSTSSPSLRASGRSFHSAADAAAISWTVSPRRQHVWRAARTARPETTAPCERSDHEPFAPSRAAPPPPLDNRPRPRAHLRRRWRRRKQDSANDLTSLH